MRVFEGAGIGGLKGIPRETADGIVRPILDVWKEDILEYLKKRKIPYRIDRSNVDTRFERNWVRHVLLPLLEKRYGKAVKKRIFTLGERFRELDDYLEGEAGRWIRRNVKRSPGRIRPDNQVGFAFRRETFSALPAVLRVKILQRICFDRLGIAPNERLLKAMDGNVSAGGPSARVNAGKGWKLANRYEEARFVQPGNPVRNPGRLRSRNRPGSEGRRSRRRRRGASRRRGTPRCSTPPAWRCRSRFAPCGPGTGSGRSGRSAGGKVRDGEKKVKEILIDRKVPREERWGRPVVCDAEGAILWIPGVLRSAHAPVTPEDPEGGGSADPFGEIDKDRSCAKIIRYYPGGFSIPRHQGDRALEPVL